ncbi:MAG: hypothetical protein HQL68_03535, partial [Magnetococcales bacterium]|nr:hypothetical protein [Magnetococcales bacterium]
NLEEELENLKNSLKQSQAQLMKEKENVKKYIHLFRKKHGECMELLEKVESRV